jgi:hypothetical protein
MDIMKKIIGKKKKDSREKGKNKRKRIRYFKMFMGLYITVSVTSSLSPFEKTLDTLTFQFPFEFSLSA